MALCFGLLFYNILRPTTKVSKERASPNRLRSERKVLSNKTSAQRVFPSVTWVTRVPSLTTALCFGLLFCNIRRAMTQVPKEQATPYPLLENERHSQKKHRPSNPIRGGCCSIVMSNTACHVGNRRSIPSNGVVFRATTL